MFGRLVHPDARDASYPMRGVVALTTDPARTSRSWFANGWWGNQGPTSMCVAYSWCMTPENRSLTADLRWVALGDLRVGDRLIGFDEHPTPNGRYFREAVVEGIRIVPRPVYEVELETGQTLRATGDHQWLTQRHWAWKTTEQLLLPQGRREGTKLPLLFDPWEDDTSWEAGWLAGLLDGEGTIGRYAHVAFGQRPGAVLDRALAILDQREKVYGTQHVPVAHHGLGRGDTVKVNINGGMKASLRMLGMIRPVRLIENLAIGDLGRLEHRPEDQAHAVVGRRFIGVEEIAMVQTSARTLIVEGYPMHNCHWLEDGPVPQPGTAPVVDPSHLYREAQKIDEWPGEGYDGTSVRAGAKVLQSMGYIASYHWGTTLDEVVRALMHVGPVVVGTNWYAGMMTPDAQALIRPQGSIVGGHAYVLDGVNIKTRLVRVKNSWGRTWGKKGFAYLTFGALEQLIREDGEACLALESPKP